MSNIRSQKLLSAARGQSCVNCGASDGTVVAAHYQGMRQHQFGKGRGIKPHDLCIADLCARCHQEFDTSVGSVFSDVYVRKIDLSERFLFCILMTLLRRVRDGVLTTDDITQ